MVKDNSAKKKRSLPDKMSPAVAQAVLEDAVLEAAADIAALSATLDASVPHKEGSMPTPFLVPETPEEEELLNLMGVPFLGPVRRQLLAEAGIATLADLQAASPGEIGGIKGVGMRNAARIKEWLATQPAPAATAPAANPPMDTASDMDLAVANQEVQDLFGRISDAANRLKDTLVSQKGLPRLERQLDKLDDASSELAEGPDTLKPKQFKQALKTLESVAALLEATSSQGTLSVKKQDALSDIVKEHRKTLQKILGR